MNERKKRPFAVLGFGSTHDALDAERLLDDMGLEVVPIPTPKSIGALCGIALRLPFEESDRARTYLERAEIHVTAQVCIEDF
jgi:hypothetical protein